MGMVRVFRFELWDRESRSFVRQGQYATEPAIDLLQGVVMYSTLKLAAACDVSGDGFLLLAQSRSPETVAS